MRSYDLDVVVTRGAGMESRHRVHAAVVDAQRRLIGAAREPETVTMWRSCAKPFQVMPLIESGGFDELGWGDDQLALACGVARRRAGARRHRRIDAPRPRHGGGRPRLRAARAARHQRGARICARPARGRRDSTTTAPASTPRCSRARTSRLALAGYERDEHPVQLAALAGGVAVDRTSPRRRSFAPSMAAASSSSAFRSTRWRSPTRASPTQHPRSRRDSLAHRARDARRAHSSFGGTDRFDSLVVEETEGRVHLEDRRRGRA